MGKQFYILEQTQNKRVKQRHPKQTYDFNPETTKLDLVGRQPWGDPLSYLPSQGNDLISQNLEKGQAALQLAPFSTTRVHAFCPRQGKDFAEL